MRPSLLAAVAFLAVSAVPSFGHSLGGASGAGRGGGTTSGGVTRGGPVIGGPFVGSAMVTPRGPAITTGQFGNVRTTTMPNGAGQGLLPSNGNGTNTLIGPAGSVTTVPTPR